MVLSVTGPVAATETAPEGSSTARDSADDSSDTYQPVVGECTQSSSWGPFVLDGGPVDCAEPHTGQTVFVGRWTSKVSPAEADRMTDRRRYAVVEELRWQIDLCDERAWDLLGAEVEPGLHRVSQFYIALNGPSPSQWAAGQRWLRCDVVAFKAPTAWSQTANSWLGLPTGLQSLPSPSNLEGILARPDLGRFRHCEARRDGDGWYEMFTCKKGVEIFGAVELKPRLESIEAKKKFVSKKCAAAMTRMTGERVDPSDILPLSSGCPTVASSWVCGRPRR